MRAISNLDSVDGVYAQHNIPSKSEQPRDSSGGEMKQRLLFLQSVILRNWSIFINPSCGEY